jgi:hypothetical protein
MLRCRAVERDGRSGLGALPSGTLVWRQGPLGGGNWQFGVCCIVLWSGKNRVLFCVARLQKRFSQAKFGRRLKMDGSCSTVSFAQEIDMTPEETMEEFQQMVLKRDEDAAWLEETGFRTDTFTNQEVVAALELSAEPPAA